MTALLKHVSRLSPMSTHLSEPMNRHFNSLEATILMVLLAFGAAGSASTVHGLRIDPKTKGL